VRMRMKKKETHRKKNIEWNRQIKELSFQWKELGFAKGKIKEEEKPSIERVLMAIKVEVNQEEPTIQE
jgi:hypothetical protein